MVGEDLISSVPVDAFQNLTKIIAALGGIIFLYLMFSIVNFFISLKKQNDISKIRKNIEEIKNLLKKRKK